MDVEKAEPMTDWHVCRIADPGEFEDGSFRALDQKDGENGKPLEVIVGKLKPADGGDGKTSTASIRYPEKDWTASEARAHCRRHQGAKFTAAKELTHEEQAHRAPFRSASGIDVERSFLPLAEVEYRDAKDGAPALIRGYAAVFDSESRDLGGFTEIVRPGAFRSFLASGQDVIATVDHDPSRILGRRGAGTLTLAEDARGLRMEIAPPDTSYARDLAASMRRGDVSGASFGFKVNGRDGQEWRSERGRRIRELRNLSLLDVAVVSSPAYQDAQAAMRSYNAWLSTAYTAPTPSHSFERARLRLMEAGSRRK